MCFPSLWPYLDETDILALLAEALAADVEAVFADQTGGVGADSAVRIGLSVTILADSMFR